MLLGDFHASCAYVTRADKKNIRLYTNASFSWLITDKVDTTVSDLTNCAYDRYIMWPGSTPNVGTKSVHKVKFSVCVCVCVWQDCGTWEIFSEGDRSIFCKSLRLPQRVQTHQDQGLSICLSVCVSMSVGPPLCSDWNISAALGWIVMKCGSDVHVPCRMNSNNFGYNLKQKLNWFRAFFVFVFVCFCFFMWSANHDDDSGRVTHLACKTPLWSKVFFCMTTNAGSNRKKAWS